MKRIPLIFTLIIVLSACGNKKKVAEVAQPENLGAPDWYLGIEKTPCFGKCPIYRMDLDKNGGLNLDARKFTEQTGNFEAQIAADDLEKINRVMLLTQWDKYEEQYMTGYSDLPSTILYFSEKVGDTTSVQYESSKAPKELLELTKILDGVKDRADWVGNRH